MDGGQDERGIGQGRAAHHAADGGHVGEGGGAHVHAAWIARVFLEGGTGPEYVRVRAFQFCHPKSEFPLPKMVIPGQDVALRAGQFRGDRAGACPKMLGRNLRS